MLNARNVVITVVVIGVVSIVAACVSLIGDPTGGGLGIDSYGTRAHGYRGLFEVLEELKVPVERSTAPPKKILDREITIALLEPNAVITSTEPVYLTAIGEWVRHGGRLVVGPSSRLVDCQACLPDACKLVDVLTELGLPGVTLEQVGPRRPENDGEQDPKVRSAVQNVRIRTERGIFGTPMDDRGVSLHATTSGVLAEEFPQGLDLTIPQFDLQVLSDSGPKPTGSVRAVVVPNEPPRTLAAVYESGTGSIAVISDARLFQNQWISKSDNAVLAHQLLATAGRPVVFEDFYHGLTVRGNPLWLFSRFPYGLLAVAMVIATSIFAWRSARFLGPPLEQPDKSRRTIVEYIEAMSRLLLRSKKPWKYTLTEIRSGLLWRARRDLGLPVGSDDEQAIVKLLARRSPEQADALREALNALDEALKQPTVRASSLETILEKVSLCVPRNAVSVRPQ
ncbi:MAG: DUF4350 domain-containing protein [Planctomycetaceae bacterium]